MFIVLAYEGPNGTTLYLPDLRRCVQEVTAESLRTTATPALQEAQLFSVELCCLAGRVALALKPSLPPEIAQQDWRPYYVNVFVR